MKTLLLLGLLAALAALGSAKPVRGPHRSGSDWLPTGEDAFPFSPKPLQCMSTDHSGGIVASYCTRPKDAHGVNGQVCFPLSFWVTVCKANVSSADELLTELLDQDADLDDVNDAAWYQTCFRYHDTWPHCVSKAKEGPSVKHYCNLWKSLPEWERLLAKALYEVQQGTDLLPVHPKRRMPCEYHVFQDGR